MSGITPSHSSTSLDVAGGKPNEPRVQAPNSLISNTFSGSLLSAPSGNAGSSDVRPSGAKLHLQKTCETPRTKVGSPRTGRTDTDSLGSSIRRRGTDSKVSASDVMDDSGHPQTVDGPPATPVLNLEHSPKAIGVAYTSRSKNARVAHDAYLNVTLVAMRTEIHGLLQFFNAEEVQMEALEQIGVKEKYWRRMVADLNAHLKKLYILYLSMFFYLLGCLIVGFILFVFGACKQYTTPVILGILIFLVGLIAVVRLMFWPHVVDFTKELERLLETHNMKDNKCLWTIKAMKYEAFLPFSTRYKIPKPAYRYELSVQPCSALDGVSVFETIPTKLKQKNMVLFRESPTQV